MIRAAGRRLKAAFRGKASPRASSAGSSRELATAHAQAGAGLVASIEALVEIAQERDDKVLLGHLRWMGAALKRWLSTSDRPPGLERGADIEEVASEFVASFRSMVNLGVEREDQELLASLGGLQRAWMAWLPA